MLNQQSPFLSRFLASLRLCVRADASPRAYGRITARHALLFLAACALPQLNCWAQASAQQSAEGDGAQTAAPTLVAPPDHPVPQGSPFPARLSSISGSVQLNQVITPQSDRTQAASSGDMPPAPPPDKLFQQASVNMPVLAGTEISTGDNGQAELQFNDGSIARVTPQSSLSVITLSSSGEQLQTVSGLSYYEVPDGLTGVLTVRVGPDTVRLARGALLRVDMDSTPYSIALLRGEAHVNNPGSDVGFEVSMGQTATIDPQSANNYDLQQDVASSSWDAWNSDRDQQGAEMAAGETNARVGSGNEDGAGWDDLDYYGTWYDVPGAGMAWAPDGVDASFDPYGSGSWGYYPGNGYLWISAYPWGWLPYHCGGWGYYPGFGYMWQPGTGCGSGFGGGGWYPYTAVHHAPPGYALPGRPSAGVLGPKALRGPVGSTPIPRSYPLHRLLIVQRGPEFRFRQNGGARPEPRPLPLKDVASGGDASGFAPTLPLVASPRSQQYRQGGGQGSFQGGSGPGGAGGYSTFQNRVNSGDGRAVFVPGPNTITPPPRVLPAPRSAVIPAPMRPISPAPRSLEPRFSAPAPAPHFSAPAPAPHSH
jgi:hypothetical protein